MDFGEEVEAVLHSKDYEKLLELIFSPENQPKIQAFGMDLITRVCECGLAFCTDLDSLRALQDILMHIVRTIRPREALIGLLEQAEIFVNSESDKFSSLLAPLQHVMLNLPKKREHSFSWVLSILNSHMKSRHSFPSTLKRELTQGKDAFLLEANPDIKDTIMSYREYCNFYDPFIQQFYIEKNSANASDNSDSLISIQRQQSILRDHLVQLLGDPLFHIDLHWDEPTVPADNPSDDPSSIAPVKMKTDARLIAERIMGFLRTVDQYPEYFYGWCSRKLFFEESKLKSKPVYCGGGDDSDEEDSDEFVVEYGSVVNYYYLIYVEGLNEDMVPQVLSPNYAFISTVRLMSSLVSNDKPGPMALLKCFLLSRKLLEKIDETQPGIRLESELLEASFITDFIEAVAYHTVYCEILEVRKIGLQLLVQLLWKFDPRGRYDFVRFVFNRIQHDGIKGYMITQLKDCIRVTLDKKCPEMKKFFTGKFLLKLLKMTCCLKNGVTTDLIDNKEQIMSALNLVLYLAIRDKGSNITGVSEALPEIEKQLLEPLYKALELSRAHYQLKLKELEDPKAFEEQLKEQKKLIETMDVKLNNDNLTPETLSASMDEQKLTLNSALGVFNIMNGILARVNEVCDAFKKSQN
ncbi:unnamed protein product [Orchesella dallaii]|uniref:Glomulin n=1 Tax=Orchesella dallaii TaxID=48710 RepID=A0ABP1RNE0_9HEXA